MNKNTKKRSLAARILCWGVSVLLVLVLVLTGTVYGIWHNEIHTIASIEHVRDRNDAHLDGDVYTMHVSGGFYLDEFVEQGGVRSDSELIDFITGKLTRGLLKMDMSAPDIGCASFTAKTPDGDVLFGRNYDFAKTNTCIIFTEASEGRHATISTADLQFVGVDTETGITSLMDKVLSLAAVYAPLDGINDAGVSCGIYMTYQGDKTVATNQNTDKPDFTSTTLLRLILDYADNVEEAVQIASTYDLHDSANTSYHYMVADASGKSAILEWVAGTDATDNDGSARKLVVHYNDNDSYVGEAEGNSASQWVTNFVVNPGYYDGCDPSAKKGYDRYLKLQQELTDRNGVVADEDAAMEILGMIGRRTWNNDDGNGCTVHSAVFNLTKKTMLWVSNENFDDPTAVFEFGFDK
ncbi:MAG: linear amide C-N hydrolase [Clostridia bacterium]|nr:linear amide C-N hydrolase [Clostridia bacterium]